MRAAELGNLVMCYHRPASSVVVIIFRSEPGAKASMRVLEMVEARVNSKAWNATVRDMAGPNLLQWLSEIPRRGGELLVVGSLQLKNSLIGCGRFCLLQSPEVEVSLVYALRPLIQI